MRRIWGGRKDVRNALYMATLASIQWNDILGSYYRKKRAEGNPHNWSMIPTMRKLLSLLNRIARDPAFVVPTQQRRTRKPEGRTAPPLTDRLRVLFTSPGHPPVFWA